ncbi:IS701 family transposase (plasmid) [Tundrisphaera lichenicola]|uniref:IS701 family transposase n=1 Tax=Tundrisphaera lichenicola TaxID=2029860 RepID=UPI003EC012DC
MTILEDPAAVALLADATVSTEDVRDCRAHLTRFLKRYLPCFYREEQRGHAAAFVRGLLSGLERKSVEPIARQAGIPRKNLQMFVGQGAWDDEAVTSEMRRHVAEKLGEPDGVIVLDPSGFPKKGEESCGVARQWCGRQGKIDNCQLGVFLAYVSSRGHAPLDRRLYLPKDWADDPARRNAGHVPDEVTYRKTWEIAADLLARSGAEVPHGWVTGDDEFGRASEFRALLRERGERYVLDVPCNTTIRDLDGRRPPRKKGRRGPRRQVPFRRADTWAATLPADRWTRLTIREGGKGPVEVEAAVARVRARLGRRIGPEERLLMIRTLEAKPEVTYSLSNASPEVPLTEVVGVRSKRHRVERVFQEAKGEVGLAHYEVRSWVGWHHHVTLSLLALWFLILERERIGGENPGGDGKSGPSDLHPVAPPASADIGRDRAGDQRGAAA